MRRRRLITLAAVAAAGASVLGVGSAYADGVSTAATRDDCSYQVDKDKPLKESDFPSDHRREAAANATSKDARDSHGDVYYTHNKFCDAPSPWRGRDWHDGSYRSFRYGTDAQGNPELDRGANTYNDYQDGYSGGYRYDERELEPDHIGAEKNPRYATE